MLFLFQLGKDSCVINSDVISKSLDAASLDSCKEVFPLNPSPGGWYWLGNCQYVDIDQKFDRLLSCYNNVMILVCFFVSYDSS